MKYCPILKAGTMIKSYEKSFSIGPSMDSTRHNDIKSDSAECIREQCEWYKNGCPAHKGENS